MPLTEALDIMGNPQGTYSGINCLIFNLKNGQSLNLYFNADENNIKYVWDIKVIGWPYKLIIFIFLAAIVIFAGIIIKIYKNKAKKQSSRMTQTSEEFIFLREKAKMKKRPRMRLFFIWGY